MNIKLIIKIVAIVAAAVLAYIFKGFVGGVLLGGAGAVVYFTLTGSTLNWKIPKKK